MHHDAEVHHAVEPFLVGLKYPADKDGVLQAAIRNRAPKDVLDLLEQLTDQRYVVPTDIVEPYRALVARIEQRAKAAPQPGHGS